MNHNELFSWSVFLKVVIHWIGEIDPSSSVRWWTTIWWRRRKLTKFYFLNLSWCIWFLESLNGKKCDEKLWQIQRKRFQICSKIVIHLNLHRSYYLSFWLKVTLYIIHNDQINPLFHPEITELAATSSNVYRTVYS